jgi:hypothetical protein
VAVVILLFLFGPQRLKPLAFFAGCGTVALRTSG